MNRRYCLALDLKNDPDLIRQYEEHHKKNSDVTSMKGKRYLLVIIQMNSGNQ